MTNLITFILFIALLVLAFYWNFKQDQQRQKDVKESGNDLRELDKRRKNKTNISGRKTIIHTKRKVHTLWFK